MSRRSLKLNDEQCPWLITRFSLIEILTTITTNYIFVMEKNIEN